MFDDPGTLEEKKLFHLVKDTLVNEGVVFLGGYANRMYLRHHKGFRKYKYLMTPDFDVLSSRPEKTAMTIKDTIKT